MTPKEKILLQKLTFEFLTSVSIITFLGALITIFLC